MGVAVDTAGNIVVVNRGNAITVFSAGSNGNVSPSAIISGSNTELNSPYGIALDSSGNIYVANFAGNSVMVYPAASNGNVSPSTTISGSDTGLDAPDGIALDSSGNIYVANGGGSGNSVTVYPAGSNGDVTPIATIAGANTLLKIPQAIVVIGSASTSAPTATETATPTLTSTATTTETQTPTETETQTPTATTTVSPTAAISPTTTATATATATVTSTPGGTPTTTITVGPASCDSGNVVEGNTSTTCVFTLNNTGFTNHAIISSITIDDTLNFGVFFTDCQAPGGIPAQSGCSINVSFTPQSTGSFATQMHVYDNATSSPQTVTITGTGTLPPSTTDTIAPNPLDFGGSPVTVANEQFITVNNTGFTNPLVLQTLTLNDTTGGYTGANEFALVPADSSCPTEPAGLGPGGNCIIAIDLTPDASHVDASIAGALVVTGNATTSPQTINLSGYGVSGVTPDGDCYTASDGSCDATQGSTGFSGQPCLIDSGTCTTVAGPSCSCQ